MRMGKCCLLSCQFPAESEKRHTSPGFQLINTKNNASRLSHSNAPVPPVVKVDNVTEEAGA